MLASRLTLSLSYNIKRENINDDDDGKLLFDFNISALNEPHLCKYLKCSFTYSALPTISILVIANICNSNYIIDE